MVRGLAADDNKTYFAFLSPAEGLEQTKEYEAELLTSVFCDERPERKSSPVLFLSPESVRIPLKFSATDLRKSSMRYLRGNGRGAFVFLPILQDRLMSRYDSLYLSNLHPDYPVDRHILLRRFRFSAAGAGENRILTSDHLSSFHITKDGSGVWTYELPVGNALSVTLLMKVTALPNENSCIVTVKRLSHSEKDLRGGGIKENDRLDFTASVDLEDRNYHGETKASQGPERFWPGKVNSFPRKTGCCMLFHAAEERVLEIISTAGFFRRKEEWFYNIRQEDETSRGLPDTTDFYSPGSFHFSLACDESISFLLREGAGNFPEPAFPVWREEDFLPAEKNMKEIMEDALSQFIVKRENNKSVIAGYPWFLDWGRDTLIVARGLLASSRFTEDVKAIIQQFASFAEQGTIPNMICGGNADNRDTSDAPLWLFTLCADLLTQFFPVPDLRLKRLLYRWRNVCLTVRRTVLKLMGKVCFYTVPRILHGWIPIILPGLPGKGILWRYRLSGMQHWIFSELLQMRTAGKPLLKRCVLPS